ncbi:hypothetical protein FACS1894147_07990 [Spirochaetia bacterium]|nr:hypothetical protein FACS1894147_07990 [Spirochaetia bacterium]
MFDDCIIMAGGSGTRLWPASNSRKPKQFLDFSGGRSFFSLALERALAAIDQSGRVIIIAGKDHLPHVIAACGDFPPKDREHFRIIGEPAAKNTAPALACGALYASLSARGGDRCILVLTSDHLISPLEQFRKDAAVAAECARQGHLVVFGIKPSSPETGYGYIERCPVPPEAPPEAQKGVYPVASFREKPDRKTAEGFLQAGRFFWNSGMFAFSSGLIMEEFHQHAPEIIGPFAKLDPPPEGAVLEDWPGLAEAYAASSAISFDYAIAEKCTRRMMVEAAFNWTDVGNWDEYARLADKKDAGVFRLESDSTFVDSDIPVALAGVEDLIVVIRSGKDGGPPAALIVKKGETQRVKDIVEQIKKAGRTDLL